MCFKQFLVIEFSISALNTDKKRLLGSGAYGIVYYGKHNELSVAVKFFRSNTQQILQDLKKEAEILLYQFNCNQTNFFKEITTSQYYKLYWIFSRT